MKDENDVAEIRQQRQAAQQAQQQAEMGAQAAQSAKVLSEADTQNPNALTDLMGAGQSV
jgi:hypothetical protein